MKAKHPKDSLTTLTDMVLPGETNGLNNLFGGELLARMDRACSIAAQRHCRRIVVTASVNHVAFSKAVPVDNAWDLGEYAANFLLKKGAKNLMRSIHDNDIEKSILIYSTKSLSLDQTSKLITKNQQNV